MLTHNFRWSHAAGNQVVPSPWQATQFPTAPAAWPAARPAGAHRTPAQIHRISSWLMLKRRYNTGSSRMPSRLAHQTRPIR